MPSNRRNTSDLYLTTIYGKQHFDNVLESFKIQDISGEIIEPDEIKEEELLLENIYDQPVNEIQYENEMRC